jgi:hypothetical protein
MVRYWMMTVAVALAGCAADEGSGNAAQGGDGPGGSNGSAGAGAAGGFASGVGDGAGTGDDASGAGDDASGGGAGAMGDPGGAGAPTIPGGSGTTAPGDLAGSEACKLVDVVISVDGSESMTEELEAMRNDVFPAFADRLVTLGGGLDSFRVATLDACPDPANFHTRGASAECSFDGGNAWIDQASPNIDAEFACVGDIYQEDTTCSGENDDEQPISTIATALEEPWLSSDNAGFARAEGLLIAIAITDEDEQPTSDAKSVDQIYDRLVTTRGDVRRIVLLGIGGGSECEGVYGSAEEATVLRAVTQRFIDNNRGVFWDLCEGRLEDGLEQAFQVIERACDELPPPGTPGGPGDTPGDSTPPPGGGTPGDNDTPGGGTPGVPNDCNGLDADCGNPPPPPCVSSTSLLGSGSSIGLGVGSAGSQLCPTGTPVGTSGPGPD